MKPRHVHRAVAAVACMGMLFPPFASADEPIHRTLEVALRPGGVLVGHVVDQQGAAKAGATVSIQFGDQEVVRTTTDQNGVFAAQGLRGGQYQIVADDTASSCRLWGPNTAPPAAQQAVVFVTGETVVRGQYVGCGPGYSEGGFGADASNYGHAWLDWVKAHPFITAGVMAAAVAAPIAVATSDHGPHS